MKRARWRLPLAVALIATMLLFAACGTSGDQQDSGSGERVVKLAYLPITHALPVLELSQESGVKVELVKYGSWPELLDALNTGKVDGASVLIELAMQAQAKGIGLKAAALGHTDGNVIVTRNDIATAADLQGKTFAIPHRSSSHHILLQEMLERAGLTINDIKVTELSPAEMPAALVSGQIQGFCVAEPFGSVAVTSGYAKVLYRSEELWEDSICCALVFNETFLNKQGVLADAVIDAYEAAGKALADKNKALAVAGTFLRQSEQVLAQSLQWIDYTELKITRDAYADLRERMVKYHISQNPPEYEAFVYTKE